MKSFICDEASKLLVDPQGQAIGGIHVVANTANDAIKAIESEAKNRNRPLNNDVIGKMSIRAKKHDLEDTSVFAQLVERDGRIVLVPGEPKRESQRS